MRIRAAYSLVEVAMALAIGAVVLWGAIGGVRFFSRPTAGNELTLDQLQEITLAARRLDVELRDAREIVFPAPGDAPRRLLYFRDYSGRLCAYYYCPSRRELRKATFDLSGLPSELNPVPARQLDEVYFSHAASGLLSWGLFSKDVVLLGSVNRENQ